MTEKDIRQLVSLYSFLDGLLGDAETSETVSEILGSVKDHLIAEMQMRLETNASIVKDRSLSLEEKVKEIAADHCDYLKYNSIEEAKDSIKTHLVFVICVAEKNGLDEVAQKVKELMQQLDI